MNFPSPMLFATPTKKKKEIRKPTLKSSLIFKIITHKDDIYRKVHAIPYYYYYGF